MSSDPTILTVGQKTEVEATLTFMNSAFRKTYPVFKGLRLTSASKCFLTYETFPCFSLPLQMWTNPFLRWDPAKYGGIQFINIDPKLIWKPDIILYNK